MSAPKRRIRIGIDFHTFDGLFQGSRSHLLGLYREVVPLAPEMDFVFLVGDPQKLVAEDAAFRAPNAECVAMPHGGGLARLGWQLASAQRRQRLDLLHVQYRGPVWPAGPLAVTIHDTLYETHPQFFTPGFVRLARWTGRRCARQAALVFTVSEFSKAEIERLYALSSEKVCVTPNGIDSRRFHPCSGTDDGANAVRALSLQPGAYAVTVGRLEPRKNHLGLLRAFAQLRRPRPPLVVVGQHYAEVQPILDEVRALGLDNEVRFLQHVDDRTLPALIRHAQVVVYPSFAEGFGMPVVEAMASGVAVLTSSGSALGEVAGSAALTADPYDHLDIARQWQRLIDEPELRQSLALRGPAQAAGYRWNTAAKVFVGALRRYFNL